MNLPHSQQGRTLEFDVLVIGSGLAGLHYCSQLLLHKPDARIALLSKVAAKECNSRYAQGGVAAVSLEGDTIASHIDDTLRAGDGLSYQPNVEAIIKEGPQAIAQLTAYAVQFRQDLAQEGGHSHRRIYNCGDHTGEILIDRLLAWVKQQPQIQIFENHIAVNLITHHHPHRSENQDEVLGAYVLDVNAQLINH